MSPHRSRTKWSVAALIGALALVLLPATTAAAQSPSQTGDYSGSGDAALVDLNLAQAEQIPSGQLLDAVLAPTRQASDTTGGLSADGVSGEDHVAYGEGTNVKSELAGQSLLSDILVEAEQTAPPDHESPAANELLSIPENPLLSATVARAEALARNIGPEGDACPGDGAPFVTSRGYSEVAEAEVLPGQLPGSASAVTLNETVSAETLTQLASVDGQSTLGVQSRSIADLTSLNLFGQADINVAAPPTLTVTAAGTDASSVTYNDPVVTINGQELVDELNITIGPDGVADLPSQLDPLEQALQPALDGLEPLFDQLGVTALRIEKTGVLDQNVSPTSASATASLLQVEVLGAEQATLLTVDIAPMQAQATAPEGGVDCGQEGPENPVVIDKSVDSDTVQPGESFDYTIEVTNNLECSLQNVTVTDVITGPASDVTASGDGSAAETGPSEWTATWNLGELAAGETTTVTATVTAADDATGSFSDTATVDADTGDCHDGSVSDEDQIDGRPEIDTGEGVLGDDETDADDVADGIPSGDTSLPNTGGGALAIVGLGGLLGAAALTRRS